MTDAAIFGIFGIVYSVIGLFWLIRREAMIRLLFGLFLRPLVVIFFVIIGLTIGILLAGNYGGNCGWSTILSVIGWVAIIKSVLILFYPFWVQTVMEALMINRYLCLISAFAALAFGSFMLYVSFFAL